MANDFYARAKAITASDTVNYDGTTYSGTATAKAIPSDAIFVGAVTTGVVPAVFPDGSVVNFTAVAGEVIPIQTIRVNSTNLGASLMVALYANP